MENLGLEKLLLYRDLKPMVEAIMKSAFFSYCMEKPNDYAAAKRAAIRAAHDFTANLPYAPGKTVIDYSEAEVTEEDKAVFEQVFMPNPHPAN